MDKLTKACNRKIIQSKYYYAYEEINPENVTLSSSEEDRYKKYTMTPKRVFFDRSVLSIANSVKNVDDSRIIHKIPATKIDFNFIPRSILKADDKNLIRVYFRSDIPMSLFNLKQYLSRLDAYYGSAAFRYDQWGKKGDSYVYKPLIIYHGNDNGTTKEEKESCVIYLKMDSETEKVANIFKKNGNCKREPIYAKNIFELTNEFNHKNAIKICFSVEYLYLLKREFTNEYIYGLRLEIDELVCYISDRFDYMTMFDSESVSD